MTDAPNDYPPTPSLRHQREEAVITERDEYQDLLKWHLEEARKLGSREGLVAAVYLAAVATDTAEKAKALLEKYHD